MPQQLRDPYRGTALSHTHTHLTILSCAHTRLRLALESCKSKRKYAQIKPFVIYGNYKTRQVLAQVAANSTLWHPLAPSPTLSPLLLRNPWLKNGDDDNDDDKTKYKTANSASFASKVKSKMQLPPSPQHYTSTPCAPKRQLVAQSMQENVMNAICLARDCRCSSCEGRGVGWEREVGWERG